jgi:hypothetical protein
MPPGEIPMTLPFALAAAAALLVADALDVGITSIRVCDHASPDEAKPAGGATAGPASGSLVIVGGGEVGPAIVSRFVALAGGRSSS